MFCRMERRAESARLRYEMSRKHLELALYVVGLTYYAVALLHLITHFG